MKLFLVLIALLVLGWGASLWMAARNEAQARSAYPPLGDFVEVTTGPETTETLRLHYVQAGEGPDLVLIHGAGGNVRDFTFDLVDRLTDRYRVTVFDRPGLGYSDALPGSNTTIADQARLLAQASDQLGLTNPMVLGHSYGSAVALAWGTTDPVPAVSPSALILLGGVSNPWDTPPEPLYRGLSSPIIAPVFAPLITAWVPEDYVRSAIASVFTPQAMPEGYDDYIGAGLTLQRSVLRENARQRVNLLPQVRAMVPDYGALDMPLEILHGDEDTTVWLTIHSVPLSQQAPDTNLVVMEGVGHAPHHAEPETVTDAIDRAATRAGLR
ncbi:MAG: alpha/beta hydrolase [Pseudomonadota bacterium]